MNQNRPGPDSNPNCLCCPKENAEGIGVQSKNIIMAQLAQCFRNCSRKSWRRTGRGNDPRDYLAFTWNSHSHQSEIKLGKAWNAFQWSQFVNSRPNLLQHFHYSCSQTTPQHRLLPPLLAFQVALLVPSGSLFTVTPRDRRSETFRSLVVTETSPPWLALKSWLREMFIRTALRSSLLIVPKPSTPWI